MDPFVESQYGNRVRIRVCGLLQRGGSLLVVNHKSLNESNFWAPPGGGIEFGETIEAALKREFAEETNLKVNVGGFLFGTEFIQNPLHAIELFYEVSSEDQPSIGSDPELNLIQGVEFKEWAELKALPASQTHGIFQFATKTDDLFTIRGFLRL